MNNRRVSFAATAHVRLFEKEEQNAPNATIQDENLFEIATQKSESSFDITISGSPNQVLVESHNSTPVKTPVKQFGLSSQSRSATPLLDAAIKNVGKEYPAASPGLVNKSIDYSSPRNFGNIFLIAGSPKVSIPRSASKFPTMSPSILPVKQESSPTLARNALGSPLVQAGLERLVKNTPKATSSLRFTQMMVDADDSIEMSMSQAPSTPGYKTESTSGTPQASTKAGTPIDSPGFAESPAIAKAGRDSIAPFFTNMRESLPVAKNAGRDSIAPFFENTRESVPSNFRSRDSLPAAFQNTAPLKTAGRDSVAGFFNNMRDSNIYNPRESIASSKRDSIVSQPALNKGRDSIAGFFSNTLNSLMPAYGNQVLGSPASAAGDESFLTESSIQMDQESMALDTDEQGSNEIRNSEGLANGSILESGSEDVDMSFDQESLNLAPTADDSFGSEKSAVSMDLTDTGKSNPFWDSQPERNAKADESVVLDGPSQSTIKALDFDTPKGPSTSSVLPENDEESPKQTLMSTPRGQKGQEDSLDLVDVSPVRSTRLRSSTKKSITQSAYTSVSTKKLKLETNSAPVSPTPAASVKKVKTPVKAKPKTPKKSSGVTPMRRAVAAKALANASMEPPVTRSRRSSVTSNQSPVAPISSPSLTQSAKKNKGARKSLGGNLLQSLKSSIEDQQNEPNTEVIHNDHLGDDNNIEEAPTDPPQPLKSSRASLTSVVVSEGQQAESQSQFQNSLDDDLMDEQHLSVMDDSILQEQASMESNRPPILDYKEFIQATGITFEDYSTPINSVPEEIVGSAFEASVAELERENFTQGSAELEKIISDLRVEIDSTKAAIDDSVPLLFDEFSQGSAKDRHEILSQLRLLKSICMERAKVEWFSWKELTLDYLYNGLQEYFEDLKSQHNIILPMLEDFKTYGKEAKEYYETLSRDVPVARQELEDKITAFEQNCTSTASEKAELNAKNSEMKLRIKELQELTAQAQSRIIEAEKKEAELCAKIEHSEKTCADLVVFDPADLATLRGQFSVLVMTHGWRPLALRQGKQSWVYDDVIELEFVNQGESYELQSRLYTAADGDKSIIKAFNSSLSHEILKDIGHSRIENVLKQFDKSHGIVHNIPDFQITMRDLSTMWESVKTLYRDIRKARHFTSSSIEWSQDQSFMLRTKFLNVPSRCHIEVAFSFSSTNGVLLYPYGKVVTQYHCDFGTVSDNLDRRINSVDNGPDYLPRICKAIQESL